MEHIAHRIADIARNIEIVGANPITLHGFTQVPNFVLVKKDISVGAKLAYAMLLKYAWGDNACLPGQLKLAEDMGAGERSVRTYLKELEAAGILEITQRGLGKTNLYRLHPTINNYSNTPPGSFTGIHAGIFSTQNARAAPKAVSRVSTIGG
jgi:hypothetical protein